MTVLNPKDFTIDVQMLAYWKQWHEDNLNPFSDDFKLKPLSELEKPGTYWVAGYEEHLFASDFANFQFCNFEQISIDKVTKRKVGDKYRGDVKGWVVPESLVDEFEQCKEVSKLYLSLRKRVISVVDSLSEDAYKKVKELKPEQMLALIDIFSGKDSKNSNPIRCCNCNFPEIWQKQGWFCCETCFCQMA